MSPKGKKLPISPLGIPPRHILSKHTAAWYISTLHSVFEYSSCNTASLENRKAAICQKKTWEGVITSITTTSRQITKSVQLAFGKQKQFIADASHELKTPLTIITTNAEVLENSPPDNKWLNNILDQSKAIIPTSFTPPYCCL